jgi:hypothetical protein
MKKLNLLNFLQNSFILLVSVVAGGLISSYIDKKYPNIQVFYPISFNILADLSITSFYILLQLIIIVLIIFGLVLLGSNLLIIYGGILIKPIYFILFNVSNRFLPRIKNMFKIDKNPGLGKWFSRYYSPYYNLYNFLLCFILSILIIILSIYSNYYTLIIIFVITLYNSYYFIELNFKNKKG